MCTLLASSRFSASLLLLDKDGVDTSSSSRGPKSDCPPLAARDLPRILLRELYRECADTSASILESSIDESSDICDSSGSGSSSLKNDVIDVWFVGVDMVLGQQSKASVVVICLL